MIPLNRRALFGLMAAASAPLPAAAGLKPEEGPMGAPADMTVPAYAARIGYAPTPEHEEVIEAADHLIPA